MTGAGAGWRMPAETEPHACTWMAWPSHGYTLGDTDAEADERPEQGWLEHPAQQDQLGQAEGDDGHHERQQGPHR